ncbi:unnamed protein product, partial [Amoebophrya sp. A120]|eukprot:GSA120T00022246001.1
MTVAPGGKVAPKEVTMKGIEETDDLSEIEIVDVENLNVPEWLREGLKRLDTDGDGLERDEVEDMLDYMSREKLAVKLNLAELDYTKFPAKVQEIMAMWDHNSNGIVYMTDVLHAARAQQTMSKQHRVIRKFLLGSVIFLCILAILNFLMTALANEQSKDMHPRDPTKARRRRALTEADSAGVAGSELSILSSSSSLWSASLQEVDQSPAGAGARGLLLAAEAVPDDDAADVASWSVSALLSLCGLPKRMNNFFYQL